MKTLQETPETMERVENSYLPRVQLTDIITDIITGLYPSDEAQVQDILNTITEFVNQNYTFKGI